MKTIKIREQSARQIIGMMLDEEHGGWSDKVLAVKKFLDDNYLRPISKNYVVQVDRIDKQVVKALTDVQLFYVVQDKFRDIIGNKYERDKFLKQVIKDWYNNKISKYGSLTAY